jgi:hypothetical protein
MNDRRQSKFVRRGEKERHDGAVARGEVGRAIYELTAGSDLNLKEASAKIDAANRNSHER